MSEPRGRLYATLVDYAQGSCNRLRLSIHGEDEYDENAKRVLCVLEPFLVARREEPNELAGTFLWTDVTLEYRFNGEVARFMKRAAQALFDWQKPVLPDEPTLLRPDGTEWLVSLSDHKDAWLRLTKTERAQLVRDEPELEKSLMLEPDDLLRSVEEEQESHIHDTPPLDKTPLAQEKGRLVYMLRGEPTDLSYRRLIEHSLVHCSRLVLVSLEEYTYEETAKRVLDELAPALVSRERRRSWPGAPMSKRAQLVDEYRLDSSTARIVEEAARGLYEWRGPGLPDDLALLRPDETPWLITAPHLRYAALELSPMERAEMKPTDAELDILVAPEGLSFNLLDECP